MECNKEDAIRAKGIAESKMQSRDFHGARKFILKAQRLYPDLDNLSHMLTVCEVHISAAAKVNGETDWYAILQVETTADEASIKKQYRKLALQLHPDKNKFAGAEAAFKLIGEANMILSDRGKRSLHDMKRATNAKYFQARQAPPQAARKQSGVTVNVATSNVHFKGVNHQQHASASPNTQTFWTLCPNCNTKYQYYKSIMDKSIRCHSCLHLYVARDMNSHPAHNGASSGVSHNPSGVHHHVFPSQQATKTAAQQRVPGTTYGTGFCPNVSTQPAAEPLSKSGANKAKEQVKVKKGGVVGDRYENVGSQHSGKRQAKPSVSSGGRKKAKKEASLSDSDSSDSEDSILKESYLSGEPNSQLNGNCNPRRSTRQKQHISYNENADSDDDDNGRSGKSAASVRSTNDGSFSQTDCSGRSTGVASGVNMPPMESAESEGNRNCKQKVHPPGGGTGVNSDETFSYPDPEFCDFDKNRDPANFAADQIWAVYDNLDGMPRFYAKIVRVYPEPFEMQYTWLEFHPVGKTEIAWSEKELPVACGKYKLGKTESCQDILMFSHIVCERVASKLTSYKMYPQKGEVWALFREWDVGWSSSQDNHREYTYEVVEVLSDFTEGRDIIVMQLVRLEGFVSLFMRARKETNNPLRIPRKDILRFSHRVPSYKLSGNEREGVPGGLFELDTASLPDNLGKTFPSVVLDKAAMLFEGTSSKEASCKDGHLTGTTKKIYPCKNGEMNATVGVNENGVHENEFIEVNSDMRAPSHAHAKAKSNSVACDANSNSVCCDSEESDNAIQPDSCDYPDPEFYNFSEDRSIEKFEEGQVWALYSELDKYPNFYGLIEKVEPKSIQLVWLEAYPMQNGEKRWLKEELPYGCGRFEVSNERQNFDSTGPFSHLVTVAPGERKSLFDINPNEGEVWAMFKNWNVGWTRTDLDNCEYELVEVVRRSHVSFTVSALTKVAGYNAVFRPHWNRGHPVTMEVPLSECLRFSHQVPAFHLTEEKGGKLRGFWELDPASVPEILFCTS